MEQTKRPWLSFIKTGQQAWHYLLAEPSTWLFYCFFQPARFKREFEVQSLWKRIVPMLRLALPIFLISYAFALVVQALASRPHVNIFNPLLTAAGAAVLAVGLVTVVGIFLGIFLGISAGIIGLGIAFGEITGSGMSGVIESSVTALVLGALWGTNIGASWGMMRRVLVGGLVGIAWGLIWGLIKSNPNVVIVAAIAFAVGYILGYYRPLLYLVSGSSSFRAFIASRKNPLQVFFHLHHSSLYWDERVFLELPGLKDMLLLAGRQDRKQALEEIAFIVTERPQQIGAARAAALEFAIQDLEQCESMRDITRVSERLTGILPRQEVLAEEVVEEIMHVTGCHPFLVQAVCSELIEHLNIENRERAEVQDVTSAGTQVLDNWWDTYFRDLWERSDQDQQTCLVALRNVGEGDALQIAQQCGLEEKTVRRTMQTLLKRDLVLQEESRYRIAAPIFCEWVERNS